MNVTGVSLAPASVSVAKLATTQLMATFAPLTATDKTGAWKSSNTAIATVDANGKVTGVATGTATITFTSTDGAKTATTTVTVTA